VNPAAITRLNLSTTLSTNAIIEGKTEDVGVIVSAGPGIDPENHRIGRHYHIVSGSIDHRGTMIQDLNRSELDAALTSCRTAGVRVFATIGKFSTRNPEHEHTMAEKIGPESDFITMGHTLSGVLNFPRRIATACFNSAVWRTYDDFAWAVEESVVDFGLRAETNILKADGGTMPLAGSRKVPVETILSGPAASVMGIMALCDIQEDSIILDIGGTTTDIAVFADGAPVIENEGMTVGSYPTLVRSLKLRPIGIGGDSALHVSSQQVRVGPDRKGPSLATCPQYPQGSVDSPNRVCVPTLTDAMNYLGLADFGDREASIQGIRELAELWETDVDALANRSVRYALERITTAVRELVHEINEKPVYTISELLKGKRIEPKKVYVMGGPAQAFAGLLEQSFGLDVVVPEHYAYANAIGAALTQTTMDALLFADTQKGRLFIPNLNIQKKINRNYDRKQAESDAKRYLLEHLKHIGVAIDGLHPEITESESFNLVEGPVTAGRIIRIKCQIRPGVIGKAISPVR